MLTKRAGDPIIEEIPQVLEAGYRWFHNLSFLNILLLRPIAESNHVGDAFVHRLTFKANSKYEIYTLFPLSTSRDLTTGRVLLGTRSLLITAIS